MRCLFDTNVLSELAQSHPNQGVITFLHAVTAGFVSVVTLHELDYGIRCLALGRRRKNLEEWRFGLEESYRNSILPVTLGDAKQAAGLRIVATNMGKTLAVADALIAGIAMHNDLILATRNTRDFDGLGLSLMNPFS